jgi:hypothetical protein
LATAAAFAGDGIDTNELERLRVAFQDARKAYFDARRAAGLTNSVPRPKRTAAQGGTVFTKAQKRFFENRRICVSRDTETIPGSVITTWYRNGKPDTKAPAVVTNGLHRIAGAEQMNPLQFVAEQFRQRAEEWQAAAETWRTSATNNAARVERVTAALDERRAEYVQKRDAAALPTTKALYQAFIDAIDRIKAKLDTEGD